MNFRDSLQKIQLEFELLREEYFSGRFGMEGLEFSYNPKMKELLNAIQEVETKIKSLKTIPEKKEELLKGVVPFLIEARHLKILVYEALAGSNKRIRHLDQSIMYYKMALKQLQVTASEGTLEHKIVIFRLLHGLINTYQNQISCPKEALELSFKKLKMIDECPTEQRKNLKMLFSGSQFLQKEKAKTLPSIAIIFSKFGDLENSNKYHLKAFPIYLSLTYCEEQMIFYSQFASMISEKVGFSKLAQSISIQNLKKFQEFFPSKQADICIEHIVTSKVCFMNGNKRKGRILVKNAIDLAEKIGQNNLEFLGNFYFTLFEEIMLFDTKITKEIAVRTLEVYGVIEKRRKVDENIKKTLNSIRKLLASPKMELILSSRRKKAEERIKNDHLNVSALSIEELKEFAKECDLEIDNKSKEKLEKQIMDYLRSSKLKKTIKNQLGNKFCEVCLKNAKKLYSCSRCREIYYCSKNCQRIDWKEHKKRCVKKSHPQKKN